LNGTLAKLPVGEWDQTMATLLEPVSLILSEESLRKVLHRRGCGVLATQTTFVAAMAQT